MIPKIKVRVLRLKSGENIICGIANKGKSFILHNPMNLMSISMKDKAGNSFNALAFKSWIEYSNDTTYIIPKTFVLTQCSPDKNVQDQYDHALFESEAESFGYDMEEIAKEMDLKKMEGMTAGANSSKPVISSKTEKEIEEYLRNQLENGNIPFQPSGSGAVEPKQQSEESPDDDPSTDEEDEDGDYGYGPNGWNPRITF